MKSGKLRHIITLQSATNSKTPAGTPVFTWSDFATLRAELVQAEAEESVKEAGAEDVETVTFRTRFIPGVTNALRLTFAGDAFNLKKVREIEAGRGLELVCQKIGGVE